MFWRSYQSLILTLVLFYEIFTSTLTTATADNQKRRHSTHRHHQHLHHQTQNDIPQADWNAWSKWTDCSVDCGIGVQRRSRDCSATTHGDVSGRCSGADKQIKRCEITGCIKPVEDACRDLEKRLYRGKRYRWVPYTHPTHACVMACRPVGAGFFLGLNKHYPDGTQCTEDKNNICIEGLCKGLGCDGVVESGARVDSCGVCGGDSSTCKHVHKSYTDSVKFGYHTIVTIPRGSTSIMIKEMNPSRNYLAVEATDSSFSINSNFRLARFGEHAGVGTEFVYERGTGEQCPDECIRADGPTTVSVDVMILAYSDNKGVEYSFYVPSTYKDYDDGTDDETSPYVFIDGGTVPGTGTKLSNGPDDLEPYTDGKEERRPIFSNDFKFKKNKNGNVHVKHDVTTEDSNVVDADAVVDPDGLESRETVETTTASHTGIVVEEETVDTSGNDTVEISEISQNVSNRTDALQSPKPGVYTSNNDSSSAVGDMYNNDNRIPSLYSWSLSGYTQCSETCGKGKKSPIIECIVTDKNVKVDQRFCSEEAKPLKSIVECNFGPCPPRWKPDSWSKCSVTCGNGMQSRDYKCVQSDGAVVNSYLCTSVRPAREQQACDLGSCTSGWYYAEWPEHCPATCGYGTITRGVHCFSEDGSERKVCPERERPQSQKSCRNDNCRGIWLTGPWSKCNVTCGEAYQTRAVACAQNQAGRITVVSENACSYEEKPSTEMACDVQTCKPEWYMSDWGKCSVSCGSGSKSRDIRCLDYNKRPSSGCVSRDRPVDREPCTERRCPPSDQSRPSIPTQPRPSRPIPTQPRPSRPNQTQKPATQRATPSPKENGDCKDSFSQCPMVLQARLCQYSYYQRLCCYTCSQGQQKT